MVGNKHKQVSQETVKQVCLQFWWALKSNSSSSPKILDFHAIRVNKGFDEGVKKKKEGLWFC